MKKGYPNYKKITTQSIEESLNPSDAKILKNFLTFCRATSNEYKVSCRRSEILQIRHIIEKPYNAWDLKDLRGFLAVLNQDSRAIWTKKGILTTLGMFIKWQYKNWSEIFNNLEDLKKLNKQLKPDNEEKYKELPDAEDIDKMVRAASNTRDKLYVLMANEAGLPPEVQVNLKWRDIKIDEPEDGVTTLEYRRNKVKDSFIFPLGKTTTYYLKQWKQEFIFPSVRKDDFIFPSPLDRTKPLSKITAWYMYKRLAKKAGIEKNIYPYKVRHKTLSESYDIFTEEVHRKLFGHTRGSKQTKTYSHKKAKEKTLAIALEKLHKVEKITAEQRNKYEKEIIRLKRLREKDQNFVMEAIAMIFNKMDMKEGKKPNWTVKKVKENVPQNN